MTLALAHRGMNERALENTLPAFRLAAELGMDGVELDVQLARCGTPVCFHDDTLQRLFGRPGAVADYTHDDLANFAPLDAARFDVDPALLRIPTLSQALEALPRDFLINIEIKAPRLALRTPTRATAQVLAEAAPRDLLVSSFNPLELARLARRLPGVPLGLLFGPEAPFYLRRGQAAPTLSIAAIAGLAALHPNWRMVSPDLVDRAHERGWAVHVWTVNDAARARWLAAEGIDAIISDVPDAIAHALTDAPSHTLDSP